MATLKANSHQTFEARRFVDLLTLLSCLATLGERGQEVYRSEGFYLLRRRSCHDDHSPPGYAFRGSAQERQ
jgi:hypothetical protein